MLTDSEILGLLRERDERAISEMERKYSTYLHTIAYNVLGNDLDAEECVNDAFMNVWEHSGESTPLKLKQYLAAAARNIAINRFKCFKRPLCKTFNTLMETLLLQII